jgi:hypothetical protein
MQPKSEINTIIVHTLAASSQIIIIIFWGMLNISKLTSSKRKKFCEGKCRISYNNWEYSSFPKMESSRLID